MRRGLLVVAAALVVGAGGVACNDTHGSNSPNQVNRAPAGACHSGKKCHPNPGPTPSHQPSDGAGFENG